MNVLGQVSGGSPLDFATYGVAGLVIAGILLGWLWPKPATDRLIRDYERVTAQRDALYQVMEDKVIPALLESSAVTTAMRPVMEQVVRALEEVRSAEVPRGGRDA